VITSTKHLEENAMDQTSDEELRWNKCTNVGIKLRAMFREYRAQEIRGEDEQEGSIIQAAGCDLSTEIVNAMEVAGLTDEEQRSVAIAVANDLMVSILPTYKGEIQQWNKTQING
jgi:hypothetical protein